MMTEQIENNGGMVQTETKSSTGQAETKTSTLHEKIESLQVSDVDYLSISIVMNN